MNCLYSDKECTCWYTQCNNQDEIVEIYDYFNKETDVWRRTYKESWEVIFEVKYSDYFWNNQRRCLECAAIKNDDIVYGCETCQSRKNNKTNTI